MKDTRRHIGILGGSFNPVHMGHLMVATYLVSWAGFDEVWLTLSPQNPLKADAEPAASDTRRLAMLSLAVEGSTGLRICDVELTLPRPSYTIATLRHLAALHPSCRFSLIIGSDNWRIFDKWRAADEIIRDFGVTVYPRPGYPVDALSLPEGVTLAEAPECSLSSTFIRKSIATGHLVEHMIPSRVLNYITEHKLYR